MKNNGKFEKDKTDLERQDARALKKRAAEDVTQDADSYVSKTRPQSEQIMGSNPLEQLAHLLSHMLAGGRAGSQDEIDGLLIYSGENGSRLVLSDELLEISREADAASLATEPIRIFHVQASAPWVQRVRPGHA